MKSLKEFPFHRARRITRSEVDTYRLGIEDLTGDKRQRRSGRPPKGEAEAFDQVAARLEGPELAPIRKQARKQGIDPQSLINRLLLSELS